LDEQEPDGGAGRVVSTGDSPAHDLLCFLNN